MKPFISQVLDAARVPALVAVGLEAMAEVSSVSLVLDDQQLIAVFTDGDHVHTHSHDILNEGDVEKVAELLAA